MRYLPIMLVCLGCVNQTFESEEHSPHLGTRDLLDAPHVTTVVVAPAKQGAKRQILHVLNWHFVDREAFEADGGEDWEAFLKSVEAVQSQQIELLQHLKDEHGIDAVFLEGMTEPEVDGYRKLAGALARWTEPKGHDELSEFLRQQHREDALLLGAAARVDGLRVLPPENPEAFEAANPVKDGKVEYDLEATERREDAIVKKMLATERTIMVLIMGGDHDLEDNIKRLTDEVEYVRVVVKAHEEIAGN